MAPELLKFFLKNFQKTVTNEIIPCIKERKEKHHPPQEGWEQGGEDKQWKTMKYLAEMRKHEGKAVYLCDSFLDDGEVLRQI